MWNSFAPLKFRFFGWLALRRRCWTSDKLQSRGLPNHGTCPLCELHAETLDHLLLRCPFSRDVWFNTLRPPGLQRLLPPAVTAEISTWWPDAMQVLPVKKRREANSLCLLIMRSLWLERNARIFDHKSCSARVVTEQISDEWRSWIACRRGPTRGLG